jgi:hypothetical protein
MPKSKRKKQLQASVANAREACIQQNKSTEQPYPEDNESQPEGHISEGPNAQQGDDERGDDDEGDEAFEVEEVDEEEALEFLEREIQRELELLKEVNA